MLRKKAIVHYDHEDIRLIGETYKGYHPQGHRVVFHLEDGTVLYWLTVLSPSKVSQVELNIGGTVEISYTDKGVDDRQGKWIQNVRFLKKSPPSNISVLTNQ